MSADIKLSKLGRVLELRIDRADKRNCLTAAMYRSMTAALVEAAAQKDIDVVLIAGEGDVFCAGNDLNDFLSVPESSETALAFILELASFDKPIVAAVQGMAVGVGATMLFHCDLVYIAPETQLLMPFVSLGIVPEAGASLLAPLVLGHAKAAALLLLGEPLDAQKAERAGLVTEIVPAERLTDHARAKAAALASQPAGALATTRRLMKAWPEGITARIYEEAAHFKLSLQSADAQEAFAAFIEKRKPTFRK